jgi:hypothetical protein
MLILQQGGRRLEPRPFIRVIRCDDGARGLMGKSLKGHGTVEAATRFWTAVEKGLLYYIRNASQNNKGAAAPFPGTLNNPRILIRQAFREQDEIGSSGMYKGRIAAQWKVYIAQHMNAKGIKLKMQEWAPKLINALWDHTTRL